MAILYSLYHYSFLPRTYGKGFDKIPRNTLFAKNHQLEIFQELLDSNLDADNLKYVIPSFVLPF